MAFAAGAVAGLSLLLLVQTGPAPAPPPSEPSKPSATSTLKSASSGSAASQSHTNANAAAPHFSPVPTQQPVRLINETTFVADGKVYPLRRYRPAATPNDPSATQWWTTGTGLPSAWDHIAGTSTIAIIDSGMALDHEEFTGRWLENTGEKGAAVSEGPNDLNCTDRGLPLAASCNNIDDDSDGVNDNEIGTASVQNPSFRNCTTRGLTLAKSCNLLDDDANGYPDDVRGWDFVNGEPNVQAGEIDPAGSGVSHGTQVTGIAAATGNNGKGIAGVNWGANVLPLQGLSDGGSGNTLTVARAIRYAADRGADVINLSLGSDLPDDYMRQAVEYALGKGAIVVAASGNESCNCIIYPARYPEVVAVGAYTSTGNPASFSNYGADLDIMAPGAGMMTTNWTSANPASAYSSNVAGTSFATPYVSGLLAIAKAKQPTASWGQRLATLIQSADRRQLTAVSPRSDTYGYGFVKADAYLSRLTSYTAQPARYHFSMTTGDTLSSPEAGACEQSALPSTPVYQIRQGGTLYYTTSELERHQATSAGATVSRIAYMCAGLPTDGANFYRMINPVLELAS